MYTMRYPNLTTAAVILATVTMARSWFAERITSEAI
jgi:hypothetical protein